MRRIILSIILLPITIGALIWWKISDAVIYGIDDWEE